MWDVGAPHKGNREHQVGTKVFIRVIRRGVALFRINPLVRLSVAMLGLTLLVLPACQETAGLQKGTAAPPGAGAHVRYRYRYYPDSAVYMDVGRKLFFYYNGEKWTSTTLLPPEIQVDWKHYVPLEMDTDKPYRHHAEIVRKYPSRPPHKQEGAKTEKE